LNKIKTKEMNNEENYSNDSIDQLGKIGDQNMEAKKKYKQLKQDTELSDTDKRIIALVKSGRPIDRVCAQFMVHKSYIEKLMK